MGQRVGERSVLAELVRPRFRTPLRAVKVVVLHGLHRDAQSEGAGAAFTVVSGVVLVTAIIVGMLYLKSVYHTARRR